MIYISFIYVFIYLSLHTYDINIVINMCTYSCIRSISENDKNHQAVQARLSELEGQQVGVVLMFGHGNTPHVLTAGSPKRWMEF